MCLRSAAGKRIARALALPVLLPMLMLPSAPAFAELPEPDRVRVLQAPREIPDAELIDQNGDPFRLGQLRGRVALIFFGFTNCPDVCPMALHHMRQLERSGGAELADVAYVMISVDGERDTPQVLKSFLSEYSPAFIGLTGLPQAVKPIASGFSAAYFKGTPVGEKNGYSVSHSPQLFLVDRTGRLRAEFYGASAAAMKTVILSLLEEG